MTADDQRISATARAQRPGPPRRRARLLARRVLWRAAPFYARRRAARAELLGRLGRTESGLEHVGKRHDEQIERLEDLARELILTAEALRRGVSDVEQTGGLAHQRIDSLEAELNAVPYLAYSPFEVLDSPVGEVFGYRSSASLRSGGSEYVDFEELFRGPAERVAKSQRPYLELVKGHEPVLDVGCGRGEFLALLSSEGIVARGVDSDAGMVERSLALGVEATLGDVNEHLASLQDASLGAVFSAQVIEHLPHEQLQQMLELARCKLRPGGLFIAETVNPHRISSLKTFWVDLTHQHPIFPEVALALSAIAGFESAYVFAPDFASFESARFESPSYALVATTPDQAGGVA